MSLIAAADPSSTIGSIGTLLAIGGALVGSIVSLVKVRQRRDLSEAEADEIREKININLLSAVREQLEFRDAEIARLRTREGQLLAEIKELKQRVSDLELKIDHPPPELA